MGVPMTLFLNDLTFSDSRCEVVVPGWGMPLRLEPFQVLVWLSITAEGCEQLPAGTLRFPALLDGGHNHTFSCREEHLRQAGLSLPLPSGERPLQVRDASGVTRPVQRLLADIWLHSNMPELAERPYPLRLGPRGIACYASGGSVSGTHLPLLGLAALCAGSLTLKMQCHPNGGTVQVHVPDVSPSLSSP
jgi:hypothetical protein